MYRNRTVQGGRKRGSRLGYLGPAWGVSRLQPRSRWLHACCGLIPRKYQLGETDKDGAVSCVGAAHHSPEVAHHAQQVLRCRGRRLPRWRDYCIKTGGGSAVLAGDMAVRGPSMSERSPTNNVRVLRCYSTTAAALGAVPLKSAEDVRSFGPACISVQVQDSTCWLWPPEEQFLAAIRNS